MGKTNDEISNADNVNVIVNVPIFNIRMMTDDEWNRLAYQNYIDRKAVQSNE